MATAKQETKQESPEPTLAEVKTFKPRGLILDESRIRLAEYERQDWTATVEESTTIEDILQPGFWSMIAVKMKPFDHIEVRSDDCSWMATFLVTECERNWAKTVLLTRYDLTKGAQSDFTSTIHRVDWKGPHFKWTVIRIKDGEKVKTGCSSRFEAEDWLRVYETNAA